MISVLEDNAAHISLRHGKTTRQVGREQSGRIGNLKRGKTLGGLQGTTFGSFLYDFRQERSEKLLSRSGISLRRGFSSLQLTRRFSGSACLRRKTGGTGRFRFRVRGQTAACCAILQALAAFPGAVAHPVA